MKNLQRTVVLIACFFCLSALWAPKAAADDWDQKTTVTFSGPVELPGIALPAGTYVFKMLNYLSDNCMVEVLTQDEQHLLALIRTIPDYRVNRTSDSSFIFEERATGLPPAVKEWFFPSRNSGHEFVYRAVGNLEPAKAQEPSEPSGNSMPEQRAEAEPMAPQSESAPEAQATEPEAEVMLEQQIQEPQQSVVPEALPKTASLLPWAGLLGLLLVAGSGLLRRIED